ncbi:MAG: DUF4240 domain-containing protein [Polyangiaceae bacterium]|nr:DUF4240 domain-containing protein [Polyangiaceae bacterium]
MATKKKAPAKKKAAAPAKKKAAPPAKKKAAPPAKKKAAPPAKKKAAPPAKKKAAPAVASADLWQLIEDAWNETAPELDAARKAPTEDNLEDLGEAAEEMLSALRAKFERLDQASLLAVDRTLERALYQIDRQEVQEVTDGSDDGFLYARGFIVAMGKRFYDAVDKNPSKAVCDAELEEMCYLPLHVYEKKFGELPRSGISRESCSNAAGW